MEQTDGIVTLHGKDMLLQPSMKQTYVTVTLHETKVTKTLRWFYSNNYARKMVRNGFCQL